MKKFILPFTGILFLLVSCGPTKDDAITFNDRIVSIQKMCLAAEGSFYDICDKLNTDDIKKALADFKSNVTACAEKVEKTEAHKDFDAYKQSAVNLIKAYKGMLDVEFTEYARLYSIPSEEYSAEDEAKQKELAAKINTSLDLLNKNFIAEQERFADKWGFTLEKKMY
ncbi:MAG: hypothetical protein HY841_07810 [Bacteroidetes bacterium]|nr:hypothetical protein [Bacteroidota bacterium]